MKFPLQILLSLALMLCSISQVKAQKAQKYLPSSPDMVIGVHPSVLNKKIPLEKLKATRGWEETIQLISFFVRGGDSTLYKKMLNDPAAFGLNTMEGIWWYRETTGDTVLTRLILPLGDKNKLETQLTASMEEQSELFEMNASPSQGMLTITNSDWTLGWNKEVLLLTHVEVKINWLNYYSNIDAPAIAIDSAIVEESYDEVQEPDNSGMEDSMEEEMVVPDEELFDESEEAMDSEDVEARVAKEENELGLDTRTWPLDTTTRYIPAMLQPVEDEFGNVPRYDSLETANKEKAMAFNRSQTNDLLTANGYSRALNNLHFQELLKQTPDVSFFMDYEQFYGDYSELNTFPRIPIGDVNHGMDPYMAFMSSIAGITRGMYRGAFLTGAMHFNNGEVVAEMRTHLNDKMKAWNKRTYKTSISKKLLKYLRGDRSVAYMGFAFHPENAWKVFREVMESGPNEKWSAGDFMFLLDAIVDEKALSKIWSGECVAAITGIQSVPKTITTYEYDEDFNQKEVIKEVIQKIPEFTLAFTHKDMDTWKRMMQLGVKYDGMEPMGLNAWKLKGSEEPSASDIYFGLTEDAVLISNSRDLVENKRNTGYTGRLAHNAEQKKLLKGHNMVMYLNPSQFAELLLSYFNADGSEAAQADLERIYNTMDYMLISDEKSKEKTSSSMRVKFRDPQKNSLLQFMEYLGILSDLRNKNEM